jgi:hypothetical protein
MWSASGTTPSPTRIAAYDWMTSSTTAARVSGVQFQAEPGPIQTREHDGEPPADARAPSSS